MLERQGCSWCGQVVGVRVHRAKKEGDYDEGTMKIHYLPEKTRNGVRKNGRRVVAYLTQYGGWWSVNEDQWNKLASCGMGLSGKTFQHRGETHGDYDLDESATRLRGRPSSIRTDTYTSSSGHGRRAFYSTIPVIQPLDFGPSDWRYADEDVRRYIAASERM
jgi:hypothetical protein